jgi:hypothetical protein
LINECHKGRAGVTELHLIRCGQGEGEWGKGLLAGLKRFVVDHCELDAVLSGDISHALVEIIPDLKQSGCLVYNVLIHKLAMDAVARIIRAWHGCVPDRW